MYGGVLLVVPHRPVDERCAHPPMSYAYYVHYNIT